MKPYAEWGDWHNRDLRNPWAFWLWGTVRAKWRLFWRCTDCGEACYVAGTKRDDGTLVTGKSADPVDPWLCPVCGAPWEAQTKWIGRFVGPESSRHSGRAHKRGWASSGHTLVEWLPLERVPAHLRPKGTETSFDRAVREAVDRELPKHLDAEFEARVRAAVEVELAALRGGT